MDVVGIVIRSVESGESDRFLTLATAGGIINVRAKGARKPKSKLKGYTGILNFGEFSLAESSVGYVLQGADIREIFGNCHIDSDRYAAAMLVLEIYEKCYRTASEMPFPPLLRALEEINYGEFYPLCAALKYGVDSAAFIGMDVTEGVFPENVCAVFRTLEDEESESVLRDFSESQIKDLLRHLAAGFRSEAHIRLVVAEKIFTE